MKHKQFIQQGQTLVTLLFFMVVVITVTGAAVVIIINNSIATSKYEQGTAAYYVAEGGIEDALIQLLRNPSYTGGTLSVGTGTAVTTVSGSGPYTVVSIGTSGLFTRKIQVIIGYTNSILSVQSWNEVP